MTFGEDAYAHARGSEKWPEGGMEKRKTSYAEHYKKFEKQALDSIDDLKPATYTVETGDTLYPILKEVFKMNDHTAFLTFMRLLNKGVNIDLVEAGDKVTLEDSGKLIFERKSGEKVEIPNVCQAPDAAEIAAAPGAAQAREPAGPAPKVRSAPPTALSTGVEEALPPPRGGGFTYPPFTDKGYRPAEPPPPAPPAPRAAPEVSEFPILTPKRITITESADGTVVEIPLPKPLPCSPFRVAKPTGLVIDIPKYERVEGDNKIQDILIGNVKEILVYGIEDLARIIITMRNAPDDFEYKAETVGNTLKVTIPKYEVSAAPPPPPPAPPPPRPPLPPLIPLSPDVARETPAQRLDRMKLGIIGPFGNFEIEETTGATPDALAYLSVTKNGREVATITIPKDRADHYRLYKIGWDPYYGNFNTADSLRTKIREVFPDAAPPPPPPPPPTREAAPEAEKKFDFTKHETKILRLEGPTDLKPGETITLKLEPPPQLPVEKYWFLPFLEGNVRDLNKVFESEREIDTAAGIAKFKVKPDAQPGKYQLGLLYCDPSANIENRTSPKTIEITVLPKETAPPAPDAGPPFREPPPRPRPPERAPEVPQSTIDHERISSEVQGNVIKIRIPLGSPKAIFDLAPQGALNVLRIVFRNAKLKNPPADNFAVIRIREMPNPLNVSYLPGNKEVTMQLELGAEKFTYAPAEIGNDLEITLTKQRPLPPPPPPPRPAPPAAPSSAPPPPPPPPPGRSKADESFDEVEDREAKARDIVDDTSGQVAAFDAAYEKADWRTAKGLADVILNNSTDRNVNVGVWKKKIEAMQKFGDSSASIIAEYGQFLERYPNQEITRLEAGLYALSFGMYKTTYEFLEPLTQASTPTEIRKQAVPHVAKAAFNTGDKRNALRFYKIVRTLYEDQKTSAEYQEADRTVRKLESEKLETP